MGHLTDADLDELMGLALVEAARATEHHDVPVGALVVGPDGRLASVTGFFDA